MVRLCLLKSIEIANDHYETNKAGFESNWGENTINNTGIVDMSSIVCSKRKR